MLGGSKEFDYYTYGEIVSRARRTSPWLETKDERSLERSLPGALRRRHGSSKRPALTLRFIWSQECVSLLFDTLLVS